MMYYVFVDGKPMCFNEDNKVSVHFIWEYKRFIVEFYEKGKTNPRQIVCRRFEIQGKVL